MVALDGGDLFAASRLWDAVPVLAEDYNAQQASGGGGTEYHTVVAMKANQCTASTTLESLRGKRACSTGYRKTAGWRMPIGRLLKDGVMDEVNDDCNANNDAESAAAFFSGMCSPGAREGSVVGTNTAIGDKLCSSCNSGQGGDFCVKDADEYAGYTGALTCMAEGQGDVAFIKHTTLTDYAWPAGQSASQYKLLCPNGGCQEHTEWATCKWATVPAHAVVVNPSRIGESTRALIREAFVAVQQNNAFTSMFMMQPGGSNVNPGDLVFKGATYRLQGVDSDMSGYMGESLDLYSELAAIEDKPCQALNQSDIKDLVEKATDGGGGIPSWGVGVIVCITLLCAGMLALVLVMWTRERNGDPLFQPFIPDHPLANKLQTITSKR